MSFRISEPIPITLHLEPESEKGPTTMAQQFSGRDDIVSKLVSIGVPAALLEQLDESTLMALADAAKQMSGSDPAKMSARQFSEKQLTQRGLVAKFAEQRKADLKAVGHTLTSYVRRFDARLAKEPTLTAEQFCGTKIK